MPNNYKNLLKAFENHVLGARSHHDWFRDLLDDVMAGFGLRLKTPWDDEVRDQLFTLSTEYAKAVKDAPIFDDILGGLYQEIASKYKSKAMGQYFTPMALCEMMAAMTFDVGIYERSGTIRVYEPACGSGAMILATIKTIYENNPELLKRTSFTMVDLDPLCCRMSAVQIMANCLINGVEIGELFIVQGNALGDPLNMTPYYHVSRPEIEPMSVQGMAAGLQHAREEYEAQEKKKQASKPGFQFDLL
ncbi:MAG: hypothetical protein COA43_00780 [Robiginitomaculum sp.]|nr:MAG: hypothetical protein COA43_00780 [Robiginitomaculum sp.]